jgi:hypothetical protein
MPIKNLNELRLEIGDSVIGMRFPSQEDAESLAEYLGVGNSDKKPELVLYMNPVSSGADVDIPDSLFYSKTTDEAGFNIADNLVRGSIRPKKNEIDLWVDVSLTTPGLIRVFEQILYQAYYSCCRLNHSNSILIHSAGVIYKGDGFIFAGPSGAGKSTIADLSSDHIVINDEICLLKFLSHEIILQETPFNGFYTKKQHGSGILKSIFLIEHGKAHNISPIERAEAVKRLSYEIVPPVGLHEIITPKTFIEMLDLADKIYSMVEVKKLEFLPDNMFWRKIDMEMYD